MSTPGALLILGLLLTTSFSLGTLLQNRASSWTERGKADSVLKMLFGEGRRLFSNQFFVQADIYFHAGYYPSIFDQQTKPKDARHMTDAIETEPHPDGQRGDEEEHESHQHTADCGHDGEEAQHYKDMAMQGPRDWIDRFGRKFTVTEHRHLANGREREMLPWLWLSAEMDPQRIDTYTVASYWLRNMGKIDEAERFLREGLRHNPTSYEILFELGRLIQEARHDDQRAANLWRLAIKHWREQESGKGKPDNMGLERLVVRLAMVEERAGNYAKAIEYLHIAQPITPAPEAIREKIEELRKKSK